MSETKATCKYQRFTVEGTREHDTLEQAMRDAFDDCEWNNAYHYEIQHKGATYNREAMLAYWSEKNWR